MALRKPSDFFRKEKTESNILVVEPDETLREDLTKVENLTSQILQLQQELTQKVVKNDLETLILSQITEMREKFDYLKNDIKNSNDNDIALFNESLSEVVDIVNNLIENEIPKYKKQVIKTEVYVDEQVNQIQETIDRNILNIREEIGVKLNDVAEVVDNNIEYFNKQIQETSGTFRKEIADVKADIIINEQHIKKVDEYIKENYSQIVVLREEVFTEIEKLPVGNLQENIERLEKKIDFIRETYSKIEPEVIVKEVIKEGLLNEPSDTKNSDPLTPLNRDFVTLDQLQQHYRLFLSRIQQQLATIGGGGETRLKYLDDIVGIATNSSAYDGKYLKYNHSLGKFEFTDVDISNDSWADGAFGPYTFGSVGIGTTNPLTETLFVNGNVRVTGTLSIGTSTITLNGGTNTVNVENLVVETGLTGPNGVSYATEGYVTEQISNLVDNAPGALNTLNELAAALNDDENFATTVTNSLALKSPINNANLTGVTTTSRLNVGVGGTIIATTNIGSVGINTTNPTSKLTVVGDVLVVGVVTATDFNSASDINLKDNISVIDNPLDKILKLEGVNFNWKDTGKKSLGVIAQEVEKVLPELVSGEESKTVNYNGLIGLLIECVKQQQKEIDELKKLMDK